MNIFQLNKGKQSQNRNIAIVVIDLDISQFDVNQCDEKGEKGKDQQNDELQKLH